MARMTKDRIRNFLLESFPLARVRDIKDSTALLEEGVLDSMSILELVDYLESELGIIAEAEELVPENFGSIDAIAAFVDSRTEESESA